MDLLQRKLTKAEWDSIEVPVSLDEQRILELIKTGFHNVHLCRNYTMSLLRHLKIAYTETIEKYVYMQYFHSHLLMLYTKYKLDMNCINAYAADTTISTTLKKADVIRFTNTQKQISEHKEDMFEFVVLGLLEKMVKAREDKQRENKQREDKQREDKQREDKQRENKQREDKQREDKQRENKQGNKQSKSTEQEQYKWLFYYYTLQTIIKYTVDLFNKQLHTIVLDLLKKLEPEVNIQHLLSLSYDTIERNEHLLKYADETLYDHQKQLFTICKRPQPKLVLYIAPTGTGKTLSPLGLSERYKVIFVCAARHVGLALAKSAISAHKKVAFAFGCNDAEDIRLHYYSAKEYTKNKKSGGIGKVDNSVGDNVEIMICDIKSYLPAMYYMLAFNSKENIIMYWDEPTITLDIETKETSNAKSEDASETSNAKSEDASETSAPHEFHEIIKKNWTNNLIPNIVLSSATLPRRDEIGETIGSFTSKFRGAEIHEIVSYDCKKTIPLINREGFVEMPHYLSADYTRILAIAAHTQKYKTLLRYIDLSEAVRFIMYITTNGFVKKTRYEIERQFPTPDTITMVNIKNYYLELLGNLDADDWTKIYDYMTNTRKQKQISNIHIVTRDAYSLTDGPTIFLADDVDKIAKFYITGADIPVVILNEISATIVRNQKVNAEIVGMEKDFQDGTAKDEDKEKKMADGRVSPEMKRLMAKIEEKKTQINAVMLDPIYVPNTKSHLYKFQGNIGTGDTSTSASASRPFTCDISEYIVERIMAIDDIENHWKLLLLMGIGVFSSTHKSDRYTEVMKTLAQEHKLFMIIASSDYIYGTNYQFCHGYISKDLEKMSQEKCIQSMGRIGRNKLQHDYSIRFRENALIEKLFKTDENKPEVRNMNALFC
jgi:hypothetical protein